MSEKKKDGNRLYSYSFLHQMNCKERQGRTLSYYRYDMNEDIEQIDNTATEWVHISPSSFPELILKLFCS